MYQLVTPKYVMKQYKRGHKEKSEQPQRSASVSVKKLQPSFHTRDTSTELELLLTKLYSERKMEEEADSQMNIPVGIQL